MSGVRSSVVLAVVVALTTSPATAEPRPAGLRPEPSSAEAGLWDASAKAEQQAKQSADLNAAPALNAYVGEVACKVAMEYCRDLRVYVFDRPFFNATMAPNGYTEVWSGLLLRVGSEAELAFVLGHEASHFAENHSIEAHEAEKARRNVGLALSIGVAVIGAAAAGQAGTYQEARQIMDATGNLIDVIYLGTVTSLFRFSRENESEADRLGIRRAAVAGYTPQVAAESWRNNIKETAASDFPNVRKAEARSSIFSTHPLSSARAAALDAEAKALPAAGELGRERHRAAIRPHLAAWLKDDLRRKDFGQTLLILDRLAENGEDLGVINFYRGETYRLRRKDGDLLLARRAYEAATGHADAPVATWRELGDLARRDKDAASARSAYESYLGKAANAEDAWLVRDSLNGLGQGT